MSFRLRCPICLEYLRPGQRLARWCRLCINQGLPAAATHFIQVQTGNSRLAPLAQILCEPQHADGWRPDGPYFAHVGCPVLNPYREGLAEATVANQVSARLLYLARHGPEALRGVTEMWFPAALLFAASYDRHDRRRPAARVVLLGGKNAGKTVLSVLCCARASFPAAWTERTGIHYWLSEPAEVGEEGRRRFESVAECIHASATGQAQLPNPTVPNPHLPHLRAAFFQAATEAEASSTPDVLDDLWRLIRRLINRFSMQPIGGIGKGIMLFDVAGENAQAGWHPVLDQVRSEADLAVLVLGTDALLAGVPQGVGEVPPAIQIGQPPDAPEVNPLEGEPDRSLAAVLQHLAVAERQRRVLVLTKADRWLLPENLERLRSRDPLDTDDSADRRILADLLQPLAHQGNRNAARLLRSLAPERGVFAQVFVVSAGDTRQNALVVDPRGIDRFVAWCVREVAGARDFGPGVGRGRNA